MDPRSEHLIGQILNPDPTSRPSAPPVGPATFFPLAHVVRPPHPLGAYTGPERRAQGYLIAEVIESAPRSSPPAPPGSFI